MHKILSPLCVLDCEAGGQNFCRSVTRPWQNIQNKHYSDGLRWGLEASRDLRGGQKYWFIFTHFLMPK